MSIYVFMIKLSVFVSTDSLRIWLSKVKVPIYGCCTLFSHEIL